MKIKTKDGMTVVKLVYRPVPEDWDMFENAMFDMYKEEIEVLNVVIEKQKREMRQMKMGMVRTKLQDILDGNF